MTHLRQVKSLLWLVVGMGLVTIVVRLLNGLGAVTHLSHSVSWGLWNAVKISIVPLSAGGFVLAAIVYIFHMEKFRPLLRLAILTGFLGYSTFAVVLLLDIGVPYRIWHPIVFWQHHSVLFEVAWCVMLYLTVLALEFAPNVLEHPALNKPLLQKGYALLKRLTVPLVIAGIVLSTLHQSSLGSLFLIVPHRLAPLWYSPLIHVLFFISAIGMGLLVITVEAFLLERFYGVKAPTDLLAPLARAGAVLMALFFVVRTADLFARGVLPHGFGASSMQGAFLLETLLAVAMPLLLLLRRVRESRGGLLACSLCAVLGVVLYRCDVALLAIDWGQGAYFPAWTEFALCFGVLAGAGLLFLFLIEKLDIYYGAADAAASASGRPNDRSLTGAAFESQLAAAGLTPGRRYSLLVVVGATLAMALLPRSAVLGLQPRRTAVRGARTIEGLRLDRAGKTTPALQFHAPKDPLPAGAGRVRLLMIDGNRDRNLVLFDHKGHIGRLAGDGSCGTCHHLNMPLDRATSCHECHRDMYEPTSLFDHASHVQALRGNDGCVECHPDPTGAKTYQTSTPCADCHADLLGAGSVIKAPGQPWGKAVGYMDAMHGLCVTCHASRVAEAPGHHPKGLSGCNNCHDTDYASSLGRISPRRRPK
jgi:Ni/Fe-hydrogenase subunit HybB-like protein